MAAVDGRSCLTVKQPMHDVHGSMALQPTRTKAASGHVVSSEVFAFERLIVAEDEAKVG